MKRAGEILLLTIENPPWKFEILGLAAGSTYDVNIALPGHTAALGKALGSIQQSAANLGADAVIGLRLTSATAGGDDLWVAATGTAVRWLPEEAQTLAEGAATTG